MFLKFFESLYLFGNVQWDNTELLIYTCKEFKEEILSTPLFKSFEDSKNRPQIRFELNEFKNSIDSACKARLDLFEFNLDKYSKILYLDTDILIQEDIQKVFDILDIKDNQTDGKIYAVAEGSVNNDTDWWGKSLFTQEELEMYVSTSKNIAFCSGTLLFHNNMKTKLLFRKINTLILNRPNVCNFHDQPYIVYAAFKENAYDNTLLSPLVGESGVINHFNGGPGAFAHKLANMGDHLNNLKKTRLIDPIVKKTKEYITEKLLPLVAFCDENIEGNLFMIHETLSFTDKFTEKVNNIVNMCLFPNMVKNVMEIGFNAGFSTLLMLMTSPTVTIDCYDIGCHTYASLCFQQIKKDFGRVNMVWGDSTVTVKNAKPTKKYDLVHIDGGHDDDVVVSDILNCYNNMCSDDTILIVDDTDFSNINRIWNVFKRLINWKDVNFTQTFQNPYHDIVWIHKKEHLDLKSVILKI
jgi:predicted O-methyltransferase YrrM